MPAAAWQRRNSRKGHPFAKEERLEWSVFCGEFSEHIPYGGQQLLPSLIFPQSEITSRPLEKGEKRFHHHTIPPEKEKPYGG